MSSAARSSHPAVKRISAFILLLSLLCLLLPMPTAGAFGDFDVDTDSDFDTDYDSGYRDRDRRSSGRSSGDPVRIWVFIAILVVFTPISFLISKHDADRKKAKESLQNRNLAEAYYRKAGHPMVVPNHPEINKTELSKWVRSLFAAMDEAWQAGNMDSLLNDFTLPAWTMFNTQLQIKNALGETTCATKPTGFKAVVRTWDRADDQEILHVCITATRCIWTVRKGTGAVIAGSQTTPLTICYDWTLVRPAGGTAPTEADGQCPNCGAQVDRATFAVCPHCQTALAYPGANWQISTISVIYQER